MTDRRREHIERRTITELAHRESDGIEVSLLWYETDGRLTVVCADERTGDRFALAADPENALDVFHHPFAYAAHKGVEHSVSTGAQTRAA